MQPTHFIVLLLALALAYSLFRITIKALAADRRFQFAEGMAAGRRERLAEFVKEHNALQLDDLQTLRDISNTLRVGYIP